MLLFIAYIAMAIYHSDISWFLMMDDFSSRHRLIGLVIGVILFLTDFIIYLVIDEHMVDENG